MLERCIDRVLGRTYTVTNAPPEAVPASGGGGFSLASHQALREDSYGDHSEELCCISSDQGTALPSSAGR